MENTSAMATALASRDAANAARAARLRILLLGCGKTKADTSKGAVLARSLYTGNLFLARKAYAAAKGLPWWILSAKHGLCDQHTPILAYDLTLRQLPLMERRQWGMRVLQALAETIAPTKMEDVVFEVHAGEIYRRAIVDNLEPGKGPEFENPLAGLGIGEQLRWYIDHTPSHLSDDTRGRIERGRARYFHEGDVGGVLDAAGNVHSDADPGL